MGMYRKEWDCCGSVTETDAWEPEHCPFCAAPERSGKLANKQDGWYAAAKWLRNNYQNYNTITDTCEAMECAAPDATEADSSSAAPSDAKVDEIVTALYRRFKDWSKRGFGPDDVTWCEVKADVVSLLAIAAPAPTGESLSAAVCAVEGAEALPLCVGICAKRGICIQDQAGDAAQGGAA